MIKDEIVLCKEEHSHDDVIQRVQNSMPSEDVLFEVAELFKIFGDSTRSKILSALNISPLCVCDIANILMMTKSAVSHQLRVLRQAKIVKFCKNGKEVIYSLDDQHIEQMYNMAIEHLMEKQ